LKVGGFRRQLGLILVASGITLGIAGCALINLPPVASFTLRVTWRFAPGEVVLDASMSHDPDGVITEYKWDFGDGSSDTGASVSHTYIASGTYAVVLEVVDDKGKTSCSRDTVTILPPHGIDSGAVAAFVVSPPSQCASPLTVQFDASASSSDRGDITSFVWRFGDGSTGSGRVVLHTYPSAGTYAVTLAVVDSHGAADSLTLEIQIAGDGSVDGNILPIAAFVATPSSGPVPLRVAFDASGSADPDGSISAYDWAFGDGSTGAGVTASHTYGTAGTYTAKLTVIDSRGGTASTTQVIQVAAGGSNASPIAAFYASPDSGTAPLTVTFNASASSDPDGSITSYAWAFGDGSTGAGVTVSHTYSTVGTYTASLTVTDNGGSTSKATRTISVAAQSGPLAFTGHGQQVTNAFSLGGGLTTFHMEHSGSRNFIVWLLDAHGGLVDLLVNEIGSFNGGKAVGIDAPGIHLLDIQADGDWSITVQQPKPASAPSPPQTCTGHGQQFSSFFALAAGLATFHMEHSGSSNFIVWLIDAHGDLVELLVNEIGNFNGGKAVGIDAPGIHLLDIQADGDWSITVQQ